MLSAVATDSRRIASRPPWNRNARHRICGPDIATKTVPTGWLSVPPSGPATPVIPMPHDMPLKLAAAYPLQVLTAWGVQLELDSADDNRITTFLDRYVQGPQTPEIGATCSDGNGTPLVLN